MTLASQIFKGELIVERPEGMDYDLYHELRRIQNKTIKKLFRRKPDRNIAKLITINPGYNKHF